MINEINTDTLYNSFQNDKKLYIIDTLFIMRVCNVQNR